jgi:signal transduction histidine kinase
MRTRTRVLVGFLAVHVALSLATGWLAWRWQDQSMREQAETRAEAIGKAIAGHPLSQGAKQELASLSGYHFRELDGPQEIRPGTVQVPVPGGASVIEVAYRTPEYERTEHEVVVGTLRLIAAGSVAFGLVALWLSRQLARPLEELAHAARTIGAGDLEAAVPAIGSGEVRSLAVELEQMRSRLRELDLANRRAERLRTLGTFTATIAHEVRNPLSAVKLTVQMLAKRLPNEAALPLVTDELERLDLIVDELLAFSKGMSARCERCDLRATVETVVRLLARQAEHAGVVVSVEGAATASADPARMRQLVMNLLLNAIQAQHGGGAVRIVVAADGFAVEDEGPGVDPARVAQLFEAFASGRAEGTGLGLHLARAIAEAHGASLRYEPRQPKGARFVLTGLQPA